MRILVQNGVCGPRLEVSRGIRGSGQVKSAASKPPYDLDRWQSGLMLQS